MAPHLVSSSGSVTGAAGASVELVCRVGGDPPPEVLWGRVDPPGELPLGRITLEENSQVPMEIYLETNETNRMKVKR